LETPKIGLFNTKITFSAFFKNIYPRLGINNPKKPSQGFGKAFLTLNEAHFRLEIGGWGN